MKAKGGETVTFIRRIFEGIRKSNLIIAFFANAFLAFGLYNIHSVSGVTEGGIIGLTLLFEHHFSLSPAISGALMNGLSYILGAKILGKNFIIYSVSSAIGFSAGYAIFELFPPIYPAISSTPLLASVAGAIFVGIGAGFSVRAGGATSGDDALAMSVSKLTGIGIQWVFLASDLAVLLLSLTYIPLSKIIYSLLTVVISGQLIGLINKIPQKKTDRD